MQSSPATHPPTLLTRWTALSIRPWFILLPIGLFILHACQFGSWIVDDAGISFAYARNFAQGYGLTAQPGVLPIEGYSNFSWVMVQVPFMALGLFDPVLTPKLIAIVCIAVAFFLIYRALDFRLAALVGLAFAALNTSFVVWCISGLENPLSVLLGSLLLVALIRKQAGLAGLSVALLAMTRPDGLAYIFIYPYLTVLKHYAKSSLKRYLLAFMIPFGLWIAFRGLYFGELLPNTAQAKGSIVIDSAQFYLNRQLFFDLGGTLGGVILLIGLPLLSIYAMRRRLFKRELWILVMCLLCSMGIYILLPQDWMGEYRFATNFFLFFYLYTALLIATVIDSRRIQSLLLIVGVVVSVGLFVPRTQAFAQSPTVPFGGKIAYANNLTAFLEEIQVEDASVLIPDVGGMLWVNTFRVVDLGGLVDPVIARVLFTNPIQRKALYQYVFEDVQPTLIKAHGIWTMRARFEADSRFREDYMPVCEWVDAYAAKLADKELHSGLYIRRDQVHDQDVAEIVKRWPLLCQH